tara:strand:+ start:30 stop:239 length:210 start_codon:yes stop_codon:yes gene_type:complete
MSKKGCRRCVSVDVKGPDDLEKAMRLLKRKLKREGFFLELRKREYYRKPSEIKKSKKRRRKAIDGTELH